ncbi:hypothetical protein [Massilia sp. Leaf139]|uniref:hypothetical protein n=1 Tax=Massilia sp. Leaf139 TaxID=1736272 RepID=UPI0006FEB15F|nr:hypothetical protein [Massilia sp. Leaf139]KQQ91612.1 hypothetical protein ASF77_06685 [Massilia sp. Leaf139]
MDTTLRSATTPLPVNTGTNIGTGVGAAKGAPAPVRTQPSQEVGSELSAPELRAPVRLAPHAPAQRTRTHFDTRLQSDVASAQQARDYLDRVASQLESVKAALSAKIAGMKSGARDLEAKARQLGATIAARSSQAGGSVNAQLEFSDGEPAQQRFRITGLDVATLQAAAPLSLSFSVGGIGGPQLAASFDPEMTPEQIAGRLDRTLAPVGLRAGLDRQGRIEFTTPEANWPAVRDSIAISGRGRATTESVAPDAKLESLALGNADALRQSLREVVQALERVRRSQDAASAALSAATLRAAQSALTPADLAISAQDFASTAASHDYESLLAITSALVGVSRERVLALLGMR